VKTLFSVIVLSFCVYFPLNVIAEESFDCPVTLGSKVIPDSPFSEFYWYGNGKKLAASVPADGIWYTTHPDHLISVKLWWWSDAYRPSMESELSVKIVSLHGDPQPPSYGRVTNGYQKSLKDSGPWAMLMGIDFPESGCWQITGRFRDQTLGFVVKVVDYTQWNN